MNEQEQQAVMESMAMDNLETYIFDEGKTISYKWLSLDQEIPVNQAKR
jgi:hypothetical protein